MRPSKSIINWPSGGVDLEARTSHGSGPLFLHRWKLFIVTFIAMVLFKTGVKIGGFDPQHYLEVATMNADFRKFEDGLKLTIDCDEKTAREFRARLEEARDQGIIDFGLVEQEEALVTCIVPSILDDDHIHFVDGAAGGYTAAAKQMKQEMAAG